MVRSRSRRAWATSQLIVPSVRTMSRILLPPGRQPMVDLLSYPARCSRLGRCNQEKEPRPVQRGGDGAPKVRAGREVGLVAKQSQRPKAPERLGEPMQLALERAHDGHLTWRMPVGDEPVVDECRTCHRRSHPNRDLRLRAAGRSRPRGRGSGRRGPRGRHGSAWQARRRPRASRVRQVSGRVGISRLS